MSMSPVQQPFHILRKDATHLWPETLVSIALLIGYAWAESQSWVPVEGFNPISLALALLRFLIPVSWLVLTSRLVHDEELVGDRQFWTTRPYTWYGLLIAKVLYLLLFICVPFLIMQVWLLHFAGLYPTHVLPAMLKNISYVSIAFLLPLIAIAAVTATFVRYISSVLGGIIYALAVLVIATYNAPEKFDAPYLTYLVVTVFVALLLGALLVQYAHRKTLLARLLILAVPIAVSAVTLLAPANALTEHRFPDTAIGSATFDADPGRQQPQGRLFSFRHRVLIAVPVTVSFAGLPPEAYLNVERVQPVIDGPNGLHYVGAWTTTHEILEQQRTAYNVSFALPEAIYNQVRDKSVALHLQLGLQTFTPGTPYIVTATEKPFPLPGHAACKVSVEDGSLDCRFPFGNPTLLEMAATVHEGGCLMPGPRSAVAHGALPPTVDALAFSPVDLVKGQVGLGESKLPICPGTPVTFTPSVEGKYGRLKIDIPAITLDGYAQRIPVGPVAGSRPAPEQNSN
jgi:hypothetical protein